MVFPYLKLINIGVLTAQIVPRRARGRPKTVSSWDDVSGGPRTQNVAWFLKDIERNRKMKYYQWRVVVKWGNHTTRAWIWELFFPDFVGTKDEGTLDISIILLAEGLAKAGDLGLAGPAGTAPPPVP